MRPYSKIRFVSFSSAAFIFAILLIPVLNVNMFSSPVVASADFRVGGFGSGNSEFGILETEGQGVHARIERPPFYQKCDTDDLAMFVGLDAKFLQSFGFPADSQIIKSGEKPKHSKFGKRVVIEIGGNGRVMKAYCF